MLPLNQAAELASERHLLGFGPALSGRADYDTVPASVPVLWIDCTELNGIDHSCRVAEAVGEVPLLDDDDIEARVGEAAETTVEVDVEKA